MRAMGGERVKIPGLDREYVRFGGAFDPRVCEGRRTASRRLRCVRPGERKLLSSLDEALDAVGLRDGMTVSFHHHLRNGDGVVNMVMKKIAERGIRDLKLAPTALFGVHAELIPLIREGVVTSIEGSVNGPIGRLVSGGCFERPVVLRSHGGRARAIEAGELRVDVAFIAAPSADEYGNASGVRGRSACGPLGYAVTDAMYAEHVVVITDELVPYPLHPVMIDQTMVDYVVRVDSIGDPSGIVSGTTRITKDPFRLKMAWDAARLIERAGLLKDGFSFQTGAGGVSLAVAGFVAEMMRERGVKGAFGSGGITSFFVSLLEEGLFRALYDVQSFDLEAVRSAGANPSHIRMSALQYASPHNCGCVVNRLDVVVLGATEVDLDFNVNVNTEADGALLHGIGGHQDTAAGAGLTIVVAPFMRGRIPLVQKRVLTVTTPGETVDAVVTERGIAVNPARADLLERLKGSDLPLVPIEKLYEDGIRFCGEMEPLEFTDRVVAVVEYRDGTLLDTVRMVAGAEEKWGWKAQRPAARC